MHITDLPTTKNTATATYEANTAILLVISNLNFTSKNLQNERNNIESWLKNIKIYTVLLEWAIVNQIF